MSVHALSWAKRQKTGSPTLKAVLLAVADYADEDGRCWPSQRRISDDTEFSVRAVRGALSELEEKGLIRREATHRPDGSRGVDVLFVAMSAAPPAGGEAPPARPPAPQAAPPAPRAGLTSFEPSKNHTLTGDDDSARARSHRLPASFRLTEADRQFARDQGWAEGEINDGEAEFVDYWSNSRLPASKALKSDWSAVWRNRVRDMSRRRGRQANGHARGPPQHRQQPRDGHAAWGEYYDGKTNVPPDQEYRSTITANGAGASPRHADSQDLFGPGERGPPTGRVVDIRPLRTVGR